MCAWSRFKAWFIYRLTSTTTARNWNAACMLEIENLGAKLHPATVNIPLPFDIFG